MRSARGFPIASEYCLQRIRMDGVHALMSRESTSPDPRPVTPEGTIGHAVSPDGRYVLTGVPEPELYPIEGGGPLPIPGLFPEDTPIRWNEDGSSIFVPFRVLAGDGLAD